MKNLTQKQQVALAIAGLIALFGLQMLSSSIWEANFVPLYKLDLETEDRMTVCAVLRGSFDFKVEREGQILVLGKDRDSASAYLAEKGLPAPNPTTQFCPFPVGEHDPEAYHIDGHHNWPRTQLENDLTNILGKMEKVDTATVNLHLPEGKVEGQRPSAKIELSLKSGASLDETELGGILGTVLCSCPVRLVKDISIVDGSGKQLNSKWKNNESR